MTTWYCVKTIWDEGECLSAGIVDFCESDEKPSDEFYCDEDYDWDYRWYANEDAAEWAIEKATRRHWPRPSSDGNERRHGE